MLLRNFIFITILFSLFSCGFTPVYKKGENSLINKLSSIKIEKIAGMDGQELRSRLADKLNPNGNVSQKLYKLKITLFREYKAIGIQQDREATRFNVIIKANYKLYNIKNNKVIDSGDVRVLGSYDIVDSQYASFVSEQDTIYKAVSELAEDIKTRLSTSLLKL